MSPLAASELDRARGAAARRQQYHCRIVAWRGDDGTAVGDNAILYSLGKITIGRLSVISQYAHICAGTHDHTSRTFPLMTPPIKIGDEVWVKCLGIDEKGRVRLSRKAAMEERDKEMAQKA